MKKKGFILMEILAIIIILSAVVIVSIPSFVNMISKSLIMSKESIVEKIIVASKQYVSTYNKSILNSLVSVGDSVQIDIDTLIDLDLIKEEDINLLKEDTIFVQITLQANNVLKYGVKHDPSLIKDIKPYIIILGDNPLYININTPYIDPGYVGYSGKKEDITNYVSVTGSVNTNKIGIYTINYNLVDLKGIESTQMTRTVIVK